MNEVNKDSIASSNAWKEFKKGYMSRSNKTPEENEKEYNMEKNEFYYDTERGKLRLIPTDDGEVQDKTGIEKWQLAPSMRSPLDMMIPGRSPLNGKKDACYHKVKSRVKVWPSAYASGQLVQCRKAGASNWGTKSKK